MSDEQRQRSRAESDEPAGVEDDAGTTVVPREEGPGSRRGTSFDPTPHVRQLRGRGGSGEYLDVKWSLVWLRREHPDAQIVTEHVQIDSTLAIFKATVSLPTGGIATGYGSETTADFRDYIEKAETKAIGRALRALGFGAPNSEGEDEIESVAPVSPAPPAVAESRPQPAAAPARSRPTPIERPAPAAAASEPAPRGTGSRPAPAAAARPRPAAAAERAPAAAASAAEDADLADYSWTSFWPWARGLGLPDKKAIEDLIGRSTDGVMPAELRSLILAARGEE